MKKIPNTFLLMKKLFLSPINQTQQKFLILMVAFLFIFMPFQQTLNDWELNTVGLWDDMLHTYENPDRVYPPWGLVLLIPFFLMQIAGVRFLSTLTISWLVSRRDWQLYMFFAVVLSPYYLFTMYLVNMDILVLVFPILLWEYAENKKWQWVGRGSALSILLLKPQVAVLIWIYLIWQNRNQWKSLILPLVMVAFITLPISIIGSPPLIFQWLDNSANPSPQNIFCWEINNVSLSNFYNPLTAVVIMTMLAIGVFMFYRKRKFSWNQNTITATLMMTSMLLSPYASQQSVSSSLAFIPTIGLTVVQYFFVLLGALTTIPLTTQDPIRVLIISVCALLFFPLSPLERKNRGLTGETLGHDGR